MLHTTAAQVGPRKAKIDRLPLVDDTDIAGAGKEDGIAGEELLGLIKIQFHFL